MLKQKRQLPSIDIDNNHKNKDKKRLRLDETTSTNITTNTKKSRELLKQPVTPSLNEISAFILDETPLIGPLTDIICDYLNPECLALIIGKTLHLINISDNLINDDPQQWVIPLEGNPHTGMFYKDQLLFIESAAVQHRKKSAARDKEPSYKLQYCHIQIFDLRSLKLFACSSSYCNVQIPSFTTPKYLINSSFRIGNDNKPVTSMHIVKQMRNQKTQSYHLFTPLPLFVQHSCCLPSSFAPLLGFQDGETPDEMILIIHSGSQYNAAVISFSATDSNLTYHQLFWDVDHASLVTIQFADPYIIMVLSHSNTFTEVLRIPARQLIHAQWRSIAEIDGSNDELQKNLEITRR